MFKIILFLLVVLGAALYFPTSRVVVMERVQPALDPAFRWSTNNQLDRMVRDLATTDRTAASFPESQGSFERWLRSRYMTENSMYDAWKVPYRLESSDYEFRVISAGADREFGTADDLVAEGERIDRNRRR